MRPGNCLQSVDVVEFRSYLIAEKPTGAAGTDCPGIDILRVAPHEITEGSLMWNLLRTCDDADLINSPNLGRQAAVDAEDGAVNDGGEN